MKDSKPSIWVVFTALLMMPTIVLGQIAECSAVVQAALNATDEVCKDTGRNQACYGHIRLEAEPQSPDATFEFNSEGDTVDLAQLGSLRLSPMNVETNTWGVALMKLQADIPNENPANVSLLVFGDVELKNAIPDPILVDVTIKGPSNANVRRQPSNRAFVLGTLTPGTTVSASGRSEDGSWIYVVMPDGSNGWLRRSLVNSDDSLTELREINPSLVSYGPMQAFYFKSGINDAPCDEAPDSGILIQTPEGAGEIDLSVNGVNIQLGSTAYLQAQASGEMTISLVEGAARVEADGVTVGVPAGTRVRVPMDANLNASGAPIGPEPYSDADLVSLPVIPLEREVEIAAALSPEAILDLLVPVSGMWQVTQIGGTCGNRDSRVTSFEIRVSEDGSSFGSGRAIYNQVETGVYVFEAPETNTRFEAVITSPYSIRLTGQTGTGASCTYDEVWIYSG
ncbi:MAG: SH3 domain-containing protein [Anaerolineae bacterium]|nr:SH3 domain-containing protein [Anaerolineae bacterium]